MGMNETPAANRVHIGFFGRRNAGKSSVLNAVTGQELAVVSEVKGTTTDPVYKTMELLPMGPVMMIDTPGYDDVGALGELRVKKTRQVLGKTDVAVLVADARTGLADAEKELLGIFEREQIPCIIAYNKSDLLKEVPTPRDMREIYISALTGTHIYELKEKIAALSAKQDPAKRLAGDLVQAHDFVVLVVPVDSAAPKGRLILPQQQVIRDLLESGAASVVVRETELKDTLAALGQKPALVVTDSQVFEKVAKEVPKEVRLTSFSILMARFKGTLEESVRGAAAIEALQDGGRVLIAEGCTHHRQCDDIGTVKLPRWLLQYTGKKLTFSFTSGTEFPEDLTGFDLVIHCGGCMLNEREMQRRVRAARAAGVPVTNYGTAIAYINGILKRSLAILPEIADIIKETETERKKR